MFDTDINTVLSAVIAVEAVCHCSVGEWDGDVAYCRGVGETDSSAETRQREPLQ